MDNNIIQTMGLLAEEAYKNYNQFEFLDSLPGYKVLEPRSTSSGFQGLLLENTDPQPGESKYVFAFRGTQGNELSMEMVKDLIIADAAYMGTGTAPQQMKDAVAFVNEMISLYPEINASNTSFTGHSLGGSIAEMASYVYGFDAYAYNGFGINNMLWDANDTSSVDQPREMDEYGVSDIVETLGEFLESLGVEVQKETSRSINTIQVGYSYNDLISGILTEIVSGQMGSTQFVINHTGNSGGFPLAWLDNHDKVILNQSIAVYNNLLELFPDQDYNSLTGILRSVSPEDKKVERFLNGLGDIVSAVPDSNHVTWSENIKNTHITNLSLENLGEKSDPELANLAKADEAHAYALLHLNTFAVTGFNYASHAEVSDENLDAISDQYWDDRALFLYQLTHPSAATFNDQHLVFNDLPSGISAESNDTYDETTTITGTTTFTFGGNTSELLNGSNDQDHLFGLSGTDTLQGFGGSDILDGGDGRDYLDGGGGQDVLFGGADDRIDTIDRTDEANSTVFCSIIRRRLAA